jgi:transposase
MVYLIVHQHIPQDRSAELLRDFYGIGVCGATVEAAFVSTADRLAGFTHHLMMSVYGSGVVHLDETGLRIVVDGKRTGHWLHVACTKKLTCYRIARRGDVFDIHSGIVVHDCFAPYFRLPGVRHALCGQHLLRELTALGEFEKEPWADEMHHLLQGACHEMNDIGAKLREIEKEKLLDPNQSPGRRKGYARRRKKLLKKMGMAHMSISSRYDAILKEAVQWHEKLLPFTKRRNKDGSVPKNIAKRIGHALAVRMAEYKDMVLLFTRNPDVPFTNNQAEQDVRMVKVHMKVSGCFRTLIGAQRLVALRSIISTAVKQGWRILETLASSSWDLALKLKAA